MKIMAWVPVPVKHDGYGYCRLVAKLGAAGLGSWLAILQTAAKSHPRGTLMRDACTPHTATSISITTRIDDKIIQKTLDLCCSRDIKWIEIVELQGDMFKPAEIPHPPAEIPHDPARKGREGKGMEMNGNEDASTALADCKHDASGCLRSVSVSESSLISDWNCKGEKTAESTREQKKPYGELKKVMLTDSEYSKLQSKHSPERLAAAIEVLDGYCASKGKAYKDFYAVFKENSWVWDRVNQFKTLPKKDKESWRGEPDKTKKYEEFLDENGILVSRRIQ